MNIIKAEPTDLYIVKNITVSTINEVYPHYYPGGVVDFFLNHHNDNNINKDIESGFVYLLFDDNNTAVGTVTVKGNELLRLFVLIEHQRMGYGEALLDFAEKEILKNHSEILISASLPAKNIYLKHGYKEISFNTIKTDNGDYLCYDSMKKEQ